MLRPNLALLILSFLAPFHAFAESAETDLERIRRVVDRETQSLQRIFKDIHAHPELGFMETRTAAIVAAELTQNGFEVRTGIGGTGVAGVLQNGEGPVLMFRADMDANAVREATNLPYSSTQEVVDRDGITRPAAHMCGHDAHTTWLIGLARAMSELKNHWKGTLVLVAQPAEEPIEGAQAMVDDGLYTRHRVPRPDYFFAFHTTPFPLGAVVTTAGRSNTGSRHIDLTFYGAGGHGSAPHLAIDPVVMAGMAIVQLQTVASRFTDPAESAVLTIGSVQAGTVHNIIPSEATLLLKLHFSTEQVGEAMVRSIRRIADGIATSFGVPRDSMPKVTLRGYAPAVVNDEELVSRIRQRFATTGLIETSIEGFVASGSEDAFALINDVPGVRGAYLYLGTAEPAAYQRARANGQEFPFMPHEPNYVVDPNAIPYGTTLAAVIAIDLLHP